MASERIGEKDDAYFSPRIMGFKKALISVLRVLDRFYVMVMICRKKLNQKSIFIFKCIRLIELVFKVVSNFKYAAN